MELLVVIAIIALLAALLFPSLIRAKASAKTSVCMSNLRQIGVALRLYVDEFEKYPSYDWRTALLPFLGKQQAVIYCPAWDFNIPYGYNNGGIFSPFGLGLALANDFAAESSVVVPSDMIAIGDSCDLSEITAAGFGWPGCVPPNHKDRRSNMAFCDGHVESSKWVIAGTNSSWWRPTDEIRVRRWFRDNEPHPEIPWPRN